MKTYKPLLLLTLLMWTSFAYSAFDYSCISKDKKVAPTDKTTTVDGNTTDTAEWKAWKDSRADWAVAQNWGCCANLKLNATTKVCEDSSLVDSSLVKCTNHGECGGGEKGCYQLREDDMFQTDSEDPAAIASMQEKEAKYEEQMNSLGDVDPKPNGQSCYRDLECESYKCDNFQCVENKICRLADKDEIAPGNIKCIEPYTKSTTNVCQETGTNYYAGLLGGITVQQVGGQQCQFELYPGNAELTPQHVKDAANLGIITTRAMEWLYSTSANEDKEDCLFTVRWMRDSMKALVERRRDILKDFNKTYIQMENDFQKVSNAKKDDPTQMLSPCGDTLTGNEVNLRRSSGMDYLCYMQNRNELFMAYEKDMKKLVADMAELTMKYESAWKWGEKDKSWVIGDWSKTWKDQSCRSWPSWHRKIKRRWSQKYVVRGKSSDNQVVIDQEMVRKYLGFMGSADDFKARKYWLIDPLMPGERNQGVNFENFGSGDGYERQLGYGGIWSSFVSGGGLLNPVAGMINSAQANQNNSGLLGIHAKLRSRIIAHLKGLRKADVPELDFIFEPEIPSSFDNRVCVQNVDKPECVKFKAIRDAGGCINNLDKTECSKTKKYIDTLQDTAMAQILAYSRHHKTKYKNYFSEDNWRKKLFSRYATDFKNLDVYYGALNEMRTKQNDCLQRVIDQLNSKDFDGTGQGITEGAGNYYNSTNTNYLGAKTTAKSYNAPLKTKKNINPYAIKITANSRSFNDKSLSDAVSSSSSAGAGSLDGAGSGALAARLKAMEDVNAQAKASGVDTASKEKSFQDKLASAGLMSTSGPGGASAASSGSHSSSLDGLDSAHKTSLDPTEGSASKTSDASANGSKGTASGAGPAAGAGMGIAAGSLGGASQSSSGPSSANSNVSDATGMSDEEKDVMAANYDRTKSEYKTHEDDSLFKVVSKTYVRNLDKILKRKKKLDDDSASEPSVPSTP